jgi:hypothetical protein
MDYESLRQMVATFRRSLQFFVSRKRFKFSLPMIEFDLYVVR